MCFNFALLLYSSSSFSFHSTYYHHHHRKDIDNNFFKGKYKNRVFAVEKRRKKYFDTNSYLYWIGKSPTLTFTLDKELVHIFCKVYIHKLVTKLSSTYRLKQQNIQFDSFHSKISFHILIVSVRFRLEP